MPRLHPMTRLRRAAALLLHVLLLQVAVLGGGMACAPVWAGLSGGIGTGSSTHAASHDMAHGAPTHGARPRATAPRIPMRRHTASPRRAARSSP